MTVQPPPDVTVLLPVFNGEPFLREAVESVLSQSYKNFELLIIDDGSTDNTATILQSFNDPRIEVIRQPLNLGLSKTLNHGLERARGRYIARMDADDISLPHRLEMQVDYLENHPEAAVVSSLVELVDLQGVPVGEWREDREAVSPEAIRAMLPRCNCLAHPAVMVRRELLKEYGYWERDLPAQDYNLWLRMAADGHRLHKIPKVLLQHRRHPASITSTSNLLAFGAKDIRVKASFLKHRFFRTLGLNLFDLHVLAWLLVEMFRFALRWTEKALRRCVRGGLLRMGAVVARLIPLSKIPDLFFFFPCYHVGGAEKVHADLLSVFRGNRFLTVITQPSKGTRYKEAFSAQGRFWDLGGRLENPVMRIFYLGLFSALVNRRSRPRILGSNTCFFYELLPLLKGHVSCFDLLHAFGGGLEDLSLPYVDRLNGRVVVCRDTRERLRRQYALKGVPEERLDRVRVIFNSLSLPPSLEPRPEDGLLKVVFVGRGSPEKRVDRVGALARRCSEKGVPIEFTLVGDLEGWLDKGDSSFVTLTGELTDDKALSAIYRDHHVLVLTSEREGFPVVLQEAMAWGVVPISTSVGGVADHVVPGETGFLVSPDRSEDDLLNQFEAHLKTLLDDRHLLEAMSKKVFQHAGQNFCFEAFQRSYKDLLA